MPHIDLGDVRLWVEDTGGDEPPLLMLHAAAGSSDCWTQQRPDFEAAGYRVITYDLRGFGKTSSRPGMETAGSIVADTEALVQAIELPRLALLGTAYGAFGALEYAVDNPSSVESLIISTSFAGLTDPEFASVRARHVRSNLNQLPTVEKELGFSYRESDPEGVKRFLEMERGAYKADGARQALRSPMTLSRLASLAVPTLVIAADEDVYAPPPVMRMLAEHIPDCEFVVIQGAGHSAYWEKPQEWNRCVLSFLEKH